MPNGANVIVKSQMQDTENAAMLSCTAQEMITNYSNCHGDPPPPAVWTPGSPQNNFYSSGPFVFDTVWWYEPVFDWAPHPVPTTLVTYDQQLQLVWTYQAVDRTNVTLICPLGTLHFVQTKNTTTTYTVQAN